MCRQAATKTQSGEVLNPIFAQIADVLDGECGREECLFDCLRIPDDEVRLAVVKCLFVVPITQFDTAELEKITQIMSKCKNISAGKTELVLSTIYWILAKFALGDPDEPDENGEDNINKKFQL